MKRKRYSRKFQRMAVERMRTCEDVRELAKDLGVTRRCLYKWRAKLDLAETAEELARPHTREASYRKKALRLERLLADKTLEVDLGLSPRVRQAVKTLPTVRCISIVRLLLFASRCASAGEAEAGNAGAQPAKE